MTTVAHAAAGGNRRDEIVRGGFDGYLAVAMSVALRRFIPAFPSSDDLRQAATLAALEVLNEFGAGQTMDVVGRAVERVLYQQAKSYGQRVWIERRNGVTIKVRGIRDGASLEYEAKTGETLSVTDWLGVRYVGVGEYSIHISTAIY